MIAFVAVGLGVVLAAVAIGLALTAVVVAVEARTRPWDEPE